MKNRLLLALAVLAACGLTGCLEFERQTLSFRHDSTTDTLYIFQDYQGIFGADNPAGLSADEIEQMTSVLKGERTFFFNNWITEYNRALLLEKRGAPKGELNADEAYEARIRALIETALANVKVENVGFYLNGSKHLCGAQRVTIRNISKVVPALNQVLSFLARDEAAKDDKTEEQRRLLRTFAESRERAVRLDGNRLEIRWPATEEDYRTFKDQTPQGKAFRESGGGVIHTNGLIIFTVGKPEAKSVSLAMPFCENPYCDNALAEARKYGVKESFDPIAAANAFLHPAGPVERTRQ